MSAYQMRRATCDLDIWVRPSPENAQRVWDALARFGAPLTTYDITLDELSKPGLVFQLGKDPHRIDFLTVIDGIQFDEAWESREHYPIDGITVPVLSIPHLLRNKRVSGRPKDRYDVDWIERKYGLGESKP